MYGVSDAYLAAAASKVRKDRISGTLRLTSGSIGITDENLVKDTLKLTKELCSGKYRIGTFDLSCLRFGIFLDNALGIDLNGATVDITYSLCTGNESYESVPLGHFLVDPVLSVRRKDILNIVAYDCGVMFDKEPSDALRQLVGTPAELIISACEECGVGTGIEADSLDNMPNSALTVNAGEKQIQTCRDIIMWCVALLCGYAFIDRSGSLTVISAKYGVAAGNSSVISTDREITAAERESIYVTDTRAYIKYLAAYVGDNIVNYTSEYVSTDEQASPAAYALEKNPLLAGCSDEVYDTANRAWLAYIDAFKQRGVDARIFGDPAIDPGDTVLFSGGDVDQRSGIIGVVTSYVWNYRGYQDIECLAAECVGSLISSGSEGAVTGASAQVRSQLSKRIDAISGGTGGVGEYINDRKNTERFNDYRGHTFDETTQKWTGGNWSDGEYDHVEGYGNKVINQGSKYNHVEGYNNYIDRAYQNHIEGSNNKVVYTSGSRVESSHIEGWGNTFEAKGISGTSASHLEGYGNKLTGGYANHVGGEGNTVAGCYCTHIHGKTNTVKKCNYSAVFGENNIVGANDPDNYFESGCSYVGVFGNCNRVKRDYCVAIGYNIDTTRDGGQNYYLAVNGDSGADYPNFTVDGSGNVKARTLDIRDHIYANYVYATAYYTRGADYAEYFEWLDGNPDGEDRCGMLVTLDGDKIIPAHGDEIYGIVSAAPSIAGNAYENEWHGKYARDVYGRILRDENGGEMLSAEFDGSREYIPRSKRPEWAAVGMTGRLVINDDGSCKVGGYVSARHGVGTSCYKNTGVRVLRRVDERHVEVMIK